VFAGGCAKNQCLKGLIEHALGKSVHVADNPEITGALGAALTHGKLRSIIAIHFLGNMSYHQANYLKNLSIPV
jgi:hypothetical protein